LRAAIYEIANEDHLPFWMLKNTFNYLIFKLLQQAVQGISVTMNVTDEVVSLDSHLGLLLCLMDGLGQTAGDRTFANRCWLFTPAAHVPARSRIAVAPPAEGL
jgi:hypothetical protein